MIEVNSLLEILPLVSAGASIVIAAVAIGFSIIYYAMVIKAFRKAEEAASRSEKSVNQIYVMLTKLSHRTQDEASYLDERVSQLAALSERSEQLAGRFESYVSLLSALSERSEQVAGVLQNNVGQLSNLSNKAERVAGIFENNVDHLAHLSGKTEAAAGRFETNVGHLADLKKQISEQLERPLSPHLASSSADHLVTISKR